MAGNINLSSHVAGAVETHTDNEENDGDRGSNGGNGNQNQRGIRKWRDVVRLINVRWYKNNEISYVIEDFGGLIDNTELTLQIIFLMKK